MTAQEAGHEATLALIDKQIDQGVTAIAANHVRASGGVGTLGVPALSLSRPGT
ncbi:hypothetical protein ACFV7Q_38705 [Streptomyces sp. NPDC059851]|uniref:hypothetical protein n=1 Tax=Streptomyces sp. NPDC059851 TaxID=3346971 RepID=UPI00364DB3E2